MNYTHSVLSCSESKAWESSLFEGNEEKEWAAMQQAGKALAQAILKDFHEIRPLPQNLKVLVLAGKGHNTGDAFIAVEEIFKHCLAPQIIIFPVEERGSMKPNTKRALACIENHDGVKFLPSASTLETQEAMLLELTKAGNTIGFHICLDGLIGMQFTAPLREPVKSLIEVVNKYEAIDFRAAIDLPSGIGDQSDKGAFQADFTYATGIFKAPLAEFENRSKAGRVRYLNLEMLKMDEVDTKAHSESILLEEVIKPLKKLRPALCDKRSFGHLAILSGSKRMPGAMLMSVKAALRSGVGLVTAMAPASVAHQLAFAVPEAMWVPLPETKDGSISVQSRNLIQEHLSSATAFLSGPGLGSGPESRSLLIQLISHVNMPIVLDADALYPEVIKASWARSDSKNPLVITPHLGEYRRLTNNPENLGATKDLLDYCRKNRLVSVLKGSPTKICNGSDTTMSPFGGPVLARGGSGDILSGIVGGILAKGSTDSFKSICKAVAWHGLAADMLAQEHGQISIETTMLLDYLQKVLRGS